MRRRLSGEIGDTLWILEHPRTITWGTAGGREHLLRSEADLAGLGVSLHATRRGGAVTCHEPGQLVGYPIVHLGERPEDRDIHRYLRLLEAALIAVLARWGLEGRRIAGRTGVWLDGSPPRKLIAIGVRCHRWVTSHGFAFNVENDLEGFRSIVPCGISDAEVTSLRNEVSPERVPVWESLVEDVHAAVARELGRPLDLLVGPEGLRYLEPGP